MKKSVVVLLINSLLATQAVATDMSHSGSGGSCSGCKVEQGQNPAAEQALLVLVEGAEISEELRAKMEETRREQASVIGAETAASLSDESLLLIISNK